MFYHSGLGLMQTASGSSQLQIQSGAQPAVVRLNCPTCSTSFILYPDFFYHKRATGNAFFCPEGHPMMIGAPQAQQVKPLEAKTETNVLNVDYLKL